MRLKSFRPGKVLGRLALALACVMGSLNAAHAKLDLFGDLPIVEAIRDGSLEATKTAIIDGASVHARALMARR